MSTTVRVEATRKPLTHFAPMLTLNDPNDFVNSLQPGQISTTLLDMLPDTITCMKSKDGIYQHVNKAFAETLQIPREEILGKTDTELFGAELALAYLKDDEYVYRSGNTIREKAEIVTHRPGLVRWYITSKIPLYNRANEIVGVGCLSRPSNMPTNELIGGPMHSVTSAVAYIYQHENEPITVEQLADACGLSISSLERHFKSHFHCSPGRFITQVRMSRACELLANPTYSISQIADRLGFSDPVVFSRTFKREMNMTPTNYRKSLRVA